MPSLVAWFWLCLAATLVLVGLTLATGRRRRRRAHVALALAAVALLAVTVVFAERMAGARDFPRGPMRIHLVFAKSAAFMVLPVAVTGILLWRSPRTRWAHRAAVIAFLTLTVIAIGTGTWVFSLSTPK
ncbi:MAG TPA: hypothetical protein VK081_13155 [Planctomycetota bacterium]|nr:hypothetical protein [Planctomycetota bacterium]